MTLKKKTKKQRAPKGYCFNELVSERQILLQLHALDVSLRNKRLLHSLTYHFLKYGTFAARDCRNVSALMGALWRRFRFNQTHTVLAATEYGDYIRLTVQYATTSRRSSCSNVQYSEW